VNLFSPSLTFINVVGGLTDCRRRHSAISVADVVTAYNLSFRSCTHAALGAR